MNQECVQTEVRPPRHAVALPPTVFVVDDDISVRESLESLIRYEGFDVKSFSSARAFLDHPVGLRPSCLLLDITMPGISGLDLQKSLAIGSPAMPIIFVTAHGDSHTVVKAMKAGAVEFLTKPFEDDELVEAIRAALEQSRDLVHRELKKVQVRRRYDALTPREREVMKLISKGMLNRQIAETFGITEVTVKAHRGQVMRKMDAGTFADLLHMMIDADLQK